MYVLHEMTPEFHQVDLYAKELLQKLLAATTPIRQGIKLSSNQDVFPSAEKKGKLYLLQEGVLAYNINSKIIFYYDPGDLVGVEHLITRTQAKVTSDFAVVADEYDGEALLKLVLGQPELTKLWSEYITTEAYLLAHFTATLVHTTDQNQPDIRTFRKGETIIQQGTQGDEVFTLVEGEAEAVVDGVQVGKISTGEIFGVIAALTGIPRTASVVATKNGVALVLPKANFVHLIESRPAMVFKMVEDMSKTLVALNEKVVGMSLTKF